MDEITYPFLNFNGATVEVWEWISNFTPRHLINIEDNGRHMNTIINVTSQDTYSMMQNWRANVPASIIRDRRISPR